MSDLINTRAISILKAFNRQEWRDFKSFIISGLGGPTGKTLEFYNYLTIHYPAFSAKGLTREAVFSVIFPQTPYDDKKLRYALTDLLKQASAFLKYRALAAHPNEANFLLSELLAQRGADKAYLAMFHADEIQVNGDATGQAEKYFNEYRKHYVHLNHFFPRQKRNEDNPISDVARNLDIFFITKKLQLLCEIVNVRNIMSVKHEFLLQDKIIELIGNGAFNDIPAITIYYRVLMTLLHPYDELHFTTLQLLLKQHGETFSRDELRDMYQYLMNYCIKKINQGILVYVQVLFEIYKLILENKIIYNGKQLSQWDFKNIVVIGIRAGEKKWVHRFIESGKNDLHPNERENAYTYNLAYYYFSEGEYRKTLALLQQVEFTDLYYQLDMRAILLKCYFETDDQETLLYHAAAFRIFITRNKLVSEYQRTIYRNLIRFTTSLMRNTANRKKLLLLQEEINEVKQVADLNWLRKKMEMAIGES